MSNFKIVFLLQKMTLSKLYEVFSVYTQSIYIIVAVNIQTYIDNMILKHFISDLRLSTIVCRV